MASQLVGVKPSSWGIQSCCLGPVRSSVVTRLHGNGTGSPGGAAGGSDASEVGDPGDAVSCGPLLLSEAAREKASDAEAARGSSEGVGGPTGGGASPGPPDPTPRVGAWPLATTATSGVSRYTALSPCKLGAGVAEARL